MVESISLVQANSASQQVQKSESRISQKVSFGTGKDIIELSNREHNYTSKESKDGKSFNKSWLYALGAAALAIGAYFVFRGKGDAKNIANAGQDIAQAAKDNLTPEMKYFEKLQANLPKFPAKGEAPIETALKNGGKRIDIFDENMSSNVSRFFDKDGVLHREIYYDAYGVVGLINVNNKAGKPLKTIMNNFDGTTSFEKYTYTNSGEISRITNSNGKISDYSYIQKPDGKKTIRERVYSGGEVKSENLKVTHSITVNKNKKIISRRISDYVNNRLVSEDCATGIQKVYVTKDGAPLQRGMKVSTGELILNKTIKPFKSKDGEEMVKIISADGSIKKRPALEYKFETFFDI